MKKDEVDLPKLPKGLYRHNKTGNIYEVIGVALHTETSEALVVYQPAKKGKYEIFVRPFSMFTDIVSLNGENVPRFEKVNTPRSFIV